MCIFCTSTAVATGGVPGQGARLGLDFIPSSIRESAMKLRCPGFALFLATLAPFASAQTTPSMSDSNGAAPGQGVEHHRGPPPQALAACQGKTSGQACSFPGRQGETVNGTCATPRRPQDATSGSGGEPAATLACRPERGADGARPTAPPAN
jgi:hypothetical protein